ncbi:hypothetical protein MOUSESFB_0996 [Candidatus Arthromitus sp. SFB-mouse-Yit]|nr:hypothetical protein MOUSESFB_0996 [Candidatus Arthromitus sp. SFB-mouse-Yit]
MLSKCKHKVFTLFIAMFLVLSIFTVRPNANTIDSNSITVKTKFLGELSGKNRFIFSVDVEKNINGVIKEFFIEIDNKIVPVSTYQISENKYIIIVNPNTKSYNINNVKLGVNVIVNRSQESIKGIASLTAKNEKFRAAKVVGDPRLLYYNQNQIVLAVEIDDPWDMLKSVQAMLVYPELRSNFNTTFEVKYILVSGELKQYAYIYLEGFPSNNPLKITLNLLFQKSLNDGSINKVTKIFLHNFQKKNIVENLVQNIYTTLLGRKPSSAELKNNTQELIDKTLSVSTLIIKIIHSNEFQNKQISDQDFVTKVYKVILDRDPDDDGKNYWVGEVKKTSRDAVLKQMLTCDEYLRLMQEIGLKV